VPDLAAATAFYGVTPIGFTGGVRVGVALGFNAAGTFGPLLLVGAGRGGGPQLDEFDMEALVEDLGTTMPFAVFNVGVPSSAGLFVSVS
jgi:hypothetical protein